MIHHKARTAGDLERSYFVARTRDTDGAAAAAREIYDRLEAFKEHARVDVVHERIFGSLSVHEQVLAERGEHLRDVPYSFVEGRPVHGEGLAGVIVSAVDRGCGVTTLVDDDGRPVGRTWGGSMPGIVLQGVHGLDRDGGGDHAVQTRRMIRRARSLLESGGSDYSRVCRTWFYLDDILGWYDEFNEARSAEYATMGMMPGQSPGGIRLPASTGIGGRNPSGATGLLDLMAVSGPEVELASNVGQKDAFEYGSAFSRAAVIRAPDHVLVLLSGTAAIDERGESMHDGDARAQIESTLDKVETLIARWGGTLAHVCASSVFLKRAADAPLFEEIGAGRGLDLDACVCTVADVCRDELLFEIDAELVLPYKDTA